MVKLKQVTIMARQSKLTAAEVAELESNEYSEHERKELRKTGFAKMKERDAGVGRLYDYHGHKEVWVDWRLNEKYQDDQMFKLVIGSGKDKVTLVLDAEQLRRHLRWI